MRHLMNPLDFSVEELDQLFDLANDIEKHLRGQKAGDLFLRAEHQNPFKL